MISFTTIGGFMLIFGSFFVLRGEIFRSVIVFTLADVCWIAAAFETGDMFAVVTVATGALFGIFALLFISRSKVYK